MEPIYTKHVTTLPDQGGEGTSRLLRHLDPAARAPDALDASEIPSVERVTACLDDLEALVARETRANHRLRKEASARGDQCAPAQHPWQKERSPKSPGGNGGAASSSSAQ